MSISSCAKTDVGRERTLNEDSHLADPDLGLFVVCDGMGGHAAGEIASSRAAATVRRSLEEKRELLAGLDRGAVRPEAIAAVLRQGIERACQEIYDEATADKSKRGMGTTCTAAVVRAGKLVLAHVGDSRLVVCRGGQVSQLSQDHTFVAEAIRQGVLKADDPRAQQYSNVVTRAVGPQRSVMVDTAVFDVVSGDTLLLCSDGLHQYFPDAAELAIMLGAPKVESIPDALIGLANERGGSDNITAIVVRIPTNQLSAAEKKRTSNVLKNIDALRHIELMHELTMAEIMRLAQSFSEIQVDAGDFVVREGDVSENLYVVVTGSVEVLRGERKIANLGAGSHFGEMALLNLRPRSATVRATSTCRMLTIDRERLYEFMRHDGLLAAKFFWKMAQILSLRLDDAYDMEGEPPKADTGRNTLRFGHYPRIPRQD